MKIVDNPLDDIAMLSALMSPAFGFTPDELAAIKAGVRDKSLYAALTERAKTDSHAAEFVDLLLELRKKAPFWAPKR